jgi:hypothetical protein
MTTQGYISARDIASLDSKFDSNIADLNKILDYALDKSPLKPSQQHLQNEKNLNHNFPSKNMDLIYSSLPSLKIDSRPIMTTSILTKGNYRSKPEYFRKNNSSR